MDLQNIGTRLISSRTECAEYVYHIGYVRVSPMSYAVCLVHTCVYTETRAMWWACTCNSVLDNRISNRSTVLIYRIHGTDEKKKKKRGWNCDGCDCDILLGEKTPDDTCIYRVTCVLRSMHPVLGTLHCGQVNNEASGKGCKNFSAKQEHCWRRLVYISLNKRDARFIQKQSCFSLLPSDLTCTIFRHMRCHINHNPPCHFVDISLFPYSSVRSISLSHTEKFLQKLANVCLIKARSSALAPAYGVNVSRSEAKKEKKIRAISKR